MRPSAQEFLLALPHQRTVAYRCTCPHGHGAWLYKTRIAVVWLQVRCVVCGVLARIGGFGG